MKNLILSFLTNMTAIVLEKALEGLRRRSSEGEVSDTKRRSHPRKVRVQTGLQATLENVPSDSASRLPLPLSRHHLLARLATFSPLTWTIEDERLSPLVCAVQGWKSHNSHLRKNELHCQGCHAMIMVKLPSQDTLDISDDELGVSIGYGAVEDPFGVHNDSGLSPNSPEDDASELMSITDDTSAPSFYKVLVDSYLRRLQSEHYRKCPFLPLLPLRPEDQDYYIKSKDVEREIHAFQMRHEPFCNNLALLNEIKFKSIPALTPVDEEFIKEYVESNIISSNKAFLAALLGWSLKVQSFAENSLSLLRCDYCCRRILLSSTHPGNGVERLPPCPYPVSNRMTEDIEFGEGGINQDPDDEEIDLLGEHEDWCCISSGWRLILNGLQSL